MNLLSDDQSRSPTVVLARSDHFCVANSNRSSVSPRTVVAARYRPSGDRAGPTTLSKPGIGVLLIVLSSTEYIVETPGLLMVSLKRIELPSGDQFTEPTLSFPTFSSRTVPPSADTRYRCPAVPGANAEKASWRPSGDHRPVPTESGAEVNWSFSLPSIRQRHRLPSGYET